MENLDQNPTYSIDLANDYGTPVGGGATTSTSGTGTSVPTSNAQTSGNLNVNLSADDVAEYFEGDISLGIGTSQYITYSPNTTFGSQRTYKAIIDNKLSKNYFVVFFSRENRGFNQITGEPTYYEYTKVSEYRLIDGSETQYEFYDYINLDGVTGTVNLKFLFEPKQTRIIQPDEPIVTSPIKSYNFDISVSSNFTDVLGDVFSIKYAIVNTGQNILTGSILLSEENTDQLSLSEDIINKSNIELQLIGELPQYFKFDGITIGNDVNNIFERNAIIPASVLKTGNLNVNVTFSQNLPIPIIKTNQTQYTEEVKDSDGDKEIKIPFTLTDANNFTLTFPNGNVKTIESTEKDFVVSYKNDFNGSVDLQKLILTPNLDNFVGNSIEIFIKFERVNDTPDILEVIYPESIDVPAFSDLNIEYEISYKTNSATSINVDLLQSDNSKIVFLNSLTPNGSFKINIKKLKESYAKWKGDITLIFTAINDGGSVKLESNNYSYTTKVIYPTIQLDEDLIKTSLMDAFKSQIKLPDLDKESKYLTHLANFGDDNQFLISSWEDDNWTLSKKSTDQLGNEIVNPEDVVETLILKLYKPLSPNITANSTLWISKLLTNPLIETVVLNEQDNLVCPPIKGPNFNVDVDFVTGKSTGYESLDDLILNSTSSVSLVNKYLSGSLINTDELNIQYYSGSEYLWDNFVHFSSAKERVDNFVYKVKLVELYESLIVSASTDYLNVGGATFTGSLSSIQEVERQTTKKNQIINAFDGFEKFLYSTSSLSWPYSGSLRLSSTDIQVENWYSNIVTLAEDYDIQNQNWINNNIPRYILNNENNQSMLLFFSMIGQHFDNIYFHTKAIENSRGLGYKQTGNISDKLLYDILKSFNWDAKNLAADNQLWNLVFGVDSDGNLVNETPAKKRNFEVWRRIVNNLPYLLKHKGTRQGIYALLSCYGIPSSNLSILEFGGPEVTDEQKGKLIIDNITTGLKFTNGASIITNWQNTDKSRKPDTIEFFVKPSESDSYNIVSGSGWSIQISGSADQNYGKVIFNYSGSNSITSSLLPLFNNRFFGIKVSREVSGSYDNIELSVKQVEKDRTIFQESVSSSIISNWNNGDLISLGNNFVGTVDEFRLWSEPLIKESFYEHVSFPEMINGNSISSSVNDLYFRLDFEYPKNLALTSSLINVDTNIYFSASVYRNQLESGLVGITGSVTILSENTNPLYSASAVGFTSITEYPYQFEVIDRTVVMPFPDGGASRFQTQKVRFESQTLVSNLSVDGRATVKSFDQSPTDSNRVGLFFSPTKELNLDIAKSFGGLNIDNYIGDPSDDYKPNYSQLDSLRNYYFQRFDNRNIYEYINLIKLYEKSMFEDIKKMLPARVKATTGLLIEPHFLERSKIARKKPIGEEYQLETDIQYEDTTIVSSQNNQYETIIDANLSENVFGENNQYETIINYNEIQKTNAENYQYTASYVYIDDTEITAENLQYSADIDAEFDATIQAEIDIVDMTTTVGQSTYEEIGFGIYGDNGYSIRTYIDKDGITKKERIKVDLIKEQKTRNVLAYNIKIDGKGDARGGFYVTSSIYFETKLNIQPYSGSKVINAGTGSIVEVKPLAGYLPTHYKNTSDLTTGLKNSYYNGSKNTTATTLDGTPPIEVFISNPNTLTVNRTGRNPSEPILEVE